MLTFQPSPHHYFWNGTRRPNVTSVLAPLTDFSMVPPDTLERARLEGVDIHKMVELHAKDDLDEAGLPEWLTPRLAALKKCIAETGFRVERSESRVYNETYGYAGQLDLVGELRVPSGRKTIEALAIIDVKRSFFGGRAIGFQTAGYAHAKPWSETLQMLVDYSRPITHRFALQLRDDGSYRLQPYPDAMDFTHFLTCLAFHKLKESMK